MLKKITITSLTILLFIPVFIFAEETGCQYHDIKDWAWSSNIGWISLTCENTNSIGEGVDYGIDIDAETDVLSGYIWSENVGWITFNEADLVDCPDAPENPENCKAWIEDGSLKGWAKNIYDISAYDEWISLSGTVDNPEEDEYGVQIDGDTLDGWAWGDTSLGWIEFSHNDGGSGGDPSLDPSGEGNYISLLEGENWPDKFDDITFSSWIYWNGLEGKPASGIYGLVNDNSTVLFEIKNEGDLYLRINGNEQTAESVVREEKWMHVAFSYNGSTKVARIYVDGEQVSSKNFNAGMIEIDPDGFHAVGNSGENNFNGYMTRIRLYNDIFE
jgi:hypothetical protein